MTMQDASERYGIPISVLQEYACRGLCGSVKKVMGTWQYDDTDLERLSLMLTLRDIGFDGDETERYMKLELEGPQTGPERIRMLSEKRARALDEIHRQERRLDRLDYLRHELQAGKERSV